MVCTMNLEHPFAQYVRILGRGKNLSRSLTEEEAEAAMAIILRGEARPEQIGAMMMLLRVKEEDPEEIAGFVRGARSTFELPLAPSEVDLDWSSYAGKRQQLPWFLLAVFTLVGEGVRIFMHGTEGHTPGRLYTRGALKTLSIEPASNLTESSNQINKVGFSYLPLERISKILRDLIDLRSIFGLRSPVHTFARMLNPFSAQFLLQGIFHPNYMKIHQGAAKLLGQHHMAVFRGEGGEIERRPNKPLTVDTVHNGNFESENWPPLLTEPRQPKDLAMDITRLKEIWYGDETDPYAIAAVTGTLAISLKLLGKASDVVDAQKKAEKMWRDRNRKRLLP